MKANEFVPNGTRVKVKICGDWKTGTVDSKAVSGRDKMIYVNIDGDKIGSPKAFQDDEVECYYQDEINGIGYNKCTKCGGYVIIDEVDTESWHVHGGMVVYAKCLGCGQVYRCNLTLDDFEEENDKTENPYCV